MRARVILLVAAVVLGAVLALGCGRDASAQQFAPQCCQPQAFTTQRVEWQERQETYEVQVTRWVPETTTETRTRTIREPVLIQEVSQPAPQMQLQYVPMQVQQPQLVVQECQPMTMAMAQPLCQCNPCQCQQQLMVAQPQMMQLAPEGRVLKQTVGPLGGQRSINRPAMGQLDVPVNVGFGNTTNTVDSSGGDVLNILAAQGGGDGLSYDPDTLMPLQGAGNQPYCADGQCFQQQPQQRWRPFQRLRNRLR